MFLAASASIGFEAAPVRAGGVQDKVELTWLAPDPCPQKAEFLAAVTRMLGDRVTIAHTLFANVVLSVDYEMRQYWGRAEQYLYVHECLGSHDLAVIKARR